MGNPVVAIGWPKGEPKGSRPGLVEGRVPKCIPTIATTPTPPRGGSASGVNPPEAFEDSYLVDSASSHMLVSKIKPCMSKYKQLYGETANGSLNQLSFI